MQRYWGVLYLAGAFTLAGTSVIAGRFVIDVLGTFTIAAVSLFFALLGLVPLCGRELGGTLQRMSRHDWLRLLLQALFGIFLFRLFLLQGLIRTSAGEAGILTGATPAVTALLAWLVLKEELSRERLLGIISTVAGILVLQGILAPVTGISREHLAGNILVLGAAVCESLFNIFSRLHSIKASAGQTPQIDPLVQSTLVSGLALVLCMGPALLEEPGTALAGLGLTGWAALVWYGLFVTALAFIFWYSGIKRCDASVAAAFSGMMPFTSLLLSVLLLGEQPGWQQWLGGFLVMLGMMVTGLKLPALKVQSQSPGG
ncbi:DMT family transporter [Sporomusa aerivorans]|uniref:DMT family transporter n=1 Tax=Sporomusa aerivorans TaxID=204936 RepID=UPI00352B42CB